MHRQRHLQAGAQALGTEALERADLYREKLTSQSSEWTTQAKERAADLAVEGKARASEAIAGIGKLVADNATLIDDKVGAKYGDYARTAARSMQETAAKIEAKDLGELGELGADVAAVRPADHIDPAYGRALRDALAAGVEVLALGADVTPEGIRLVRRLEVEVPALG